MLDNATLAGPIHWSNNNTELNVELAGATVVCDDTAAVVLEHGAGGVILAGRSGASPGF